MSDDAALLSDENVLQAFRVIGERLDGGGPAPPLLTLRERLAGELLGDSRRVAATLAPEFSLVGSPPSTIAGRVVADGIRRQGNAGVMVWAELDDLLVETGVAAGDGLLHTFHPEPGSITSYPFAFFIHYAGDLMESEVAFLDEDRTMAWTVFDATSCPSAVNTRIWDWVEPRPAQMERVSVSSHLVMSMSS